MNRSEVEQKISSLETRRLEAQSRLKQSSDRLAELDEERTAVLGEAKLAERQASAIDEHMERLGAELAAAKVAEAYAALQEAVRQRDAAVEEASDAAARLSSAIERVSGARDALRDAHTQLQSLEPKAPLALPPEPTVFDERWRALAPRVEAELGVRLESELIEAAARSSNYLLLENLPEHLQELARRRGRDLRAKRPAPR